METQLKILIVEDVADDVELISRQLRAAGLNCRLDRAETEDAFRLSLASATPTLILSDYSLPQFDGLKALAIASAQAPDTPFIFVTGTMGEERAIEALRAGATDYVLKGNLARLVPVVKRALKDADNHAAKQAAERMLHDIITTSQDWIWQLDKEQRFSFCNQTVYRILGYQPEELLGRPFHELLHQDDWAQVRSLLPQAGGAQSVTGVSARWRTRHGSYCWLERNATILLDGEGRCAGYRGSDRDVTARYQQHARLQRLTRVHQMLSSTNSAIVRSRSRDGLLAEACRIAVDKGGYDSALIYLQREGSNILDALASAGTRFSQPSALPTNDTAPEAAPLSAEAILSARPIVCAAADGNPAIVFPTEQVLSHTSGSIAVLPLIVDGTAIGIFTFIAREDGIFDAPELQVLRELAANIAFALQYFQKNDAIEFLSYFDATTALAKRTLFCERMVRSLSQTDCANETTVIVVFDIQRLSVINDSYGRYIGDRLLAQIADRMKSVLGETEHLAHFGGGTFAIATRGAASSAETGHVAQNVAARLFIEPFHIDDHEIRPSIRSGIAYLPFDGATVEAVVQNAEAALKHAQIGGEKYVLYAQLNTGGSATHSAIEARLQNALAHSEFVLFYQPKVDLTTGAVEGVEALLRWQDPETGLVSPAAFIPLLESSGMILDVGDWVIGQAARDCLEWMRLGLAPMHVAVNVSPLQLRGREFVERVLAATRGWTTDQIGIDLEITESTLVHDLAASTRKLERLRKAGLRIAIDDFGTGYSSLRHLAKLPVDTLKIDLSFIQGLTQNPDDRTIVGTIISLAKSFHMTTVAEGVETDEQLQALRAMKCDVAQGYLFCKPMPMNDLCDWLRRLRSARKESRSA